VLAVTNAWGDETKFTYDLRGEISTVTDENGNTTQYEYDGRGKLRFRKNIYL